MFRKKEKCVYVKLSDKAVGFIKTVVVPELNLTHPITNMDICKIESWIYELEDLQYNEDGDVIKLDDALKEKISNAQDLLAELSSIWNGDDTLEDLDDLNKRLGRI